MTSPIERIAWSLICSAVTTLTAWGGWRLLRDGNYVAAIDDVLAQKRAALYEHKTQMTRYLDDARWLTLGDVSGGEFLAYFLQTHEVFQRYCYAGGKENRHAHYQN